MQKLGMIQAYSPLDEGQDALFVHPQGNIDNARLVKFRLLAESAVHLYLVPVDYDYDREKVTAYHDDPEFTIFLTAVQPGYEEVEFHYRGSFCLRLKGGGVWLDTYDNTALNVESADPQSYARLWEREERDPRILEIERAARHNQMILAEQMRADFAAHAAALEERYRASGVSPAINGNGGAAGVSGDVGGQVPSSALSGDNPASGAPEVGNGGES